MADLELPDYERPPVVETILGVQFDPIADFRTAHLGAFWATLGDEWPTTDEAPPLEPQFEKFDDASKWAELGFRLKLSSEPQTRLRIRNRTNDRMIQIQNGRLIVNWLGGHGGNYPRYAAIRADFSNDLEMFRRYLREKAALPLPHANQWEVTYINHIPRGSVWQTPADWGFFLPLESLRLPELQVDLASLASEWHYVIPPQRGRLHISWQHSLRAENTEIVVLTLTARGACEADELIPAPVLQGLDLGRETIVRSFRQLMSDGANRYWGLKHADRPHA